ncbi:MAG: glycosyltransferase, partial [Gemmatimonadota bacterium]
VRFTGYVRDQDLLRELYCGCFAYLHGHEFGGTNPALLKALGFGACILALDTPFSQEVLNRGRHGVYFEKDPQSLADVVDELERSPGDAEQMRSRARDRITERYTWERVVDEYEVLFSRLVHGS